MWFSAIAQSKNPGPDELVMFLDSVNNFFDFVLSEEKSFGFLWERDQRLRYLAVETFRNDVLEASSFLKRVIPNISAVQSHLHGLSGRPLQFKLAVIDSVTRQWQELRQSLNPRDWLKRAIDAIDALLDSLISAAGGAGGLIKEFKDALRSLV